MVFLSIFAAMMTMAVLVVKFVLLSNGIMIDTDHMIPLTDWSLSSGGMVYSNIMTKGTMPGDVISILHDAEIINDPYYDPNFLTPQRHMWMGGKEEEENTANITEKEWTRTWIYSMTFETPLDDPGISWKIRLEGVKMGAKVIVNDVTVGKGSSQSNGFAVGKENSRGD
jgi:hypothetical protein